MHPPIGQPICDMVRFFPFVLQNPTAVVKARERKLLPQKKKEIEKKHAATNETELPFP